jgi:hypothetical protein
LIAAMSSDPITSSDPMISDTFDPELEAEFAAEFEPEAEATPGKKGMVGKAVAVAVKMWLRSQLEGHQNLQLEIQATNRQLLTGTIPQVNVSGEELVYRGLYLTQIQLQANQIKANLGQVMRGKSFQLQQNIRVAANVILQQDDLSASASAPLLSRALGQLLLLLLKSSPGFVELLADLVQAADPSLTNVDLTLLKACQIHNPQIRLGDQRVSLSLPLRTPQNVTLPLALRFGVELPNPQSMRLRHVEWLTSLEANRGRPIAELDGLTADLGDLSIQSLLLHPEALKATCEFTVRS